MIRNRERYEAVRRLRETGESISAISRTLALDRLTVRRFVRASGLAELQAKTLQRASLVDGFTDYLHRRWTEEATAAVALTKEIAALGYRGSEQAGRFYRPEPVRCGAFGFPANLGSASLVPRTISAGVIPRCTVSTTRNVRVNRELGRVPPRFLCGCPANSP